MDKGEPKDWSEHPFDRDPDFQEELIHILSNEDVAEADYDYSPDVYDDTYLSMELALPKMGVTSSTFWSRHQTPMRCQWSSHQKGQW